MRQAGRDLLSLALMDARNHTLRLFGDEVIPHFQAKAKRAAAAN